MSAIVSSSKIEKKIIVVGTNANIILQVMLSAYSGGINRCYVISSPEGQSLRLSTLCAKYFKVDLSGNADELFSKIVNLISEENWGITLVPADCEGARIINRTAKFIKARIAPFPDLSTLEVFDNKWRFYQFCVENGFNTPLTLNVGEKEDINFNSVVLNLGLPFVLKPVNQGGSTGVHIIYSEEYYKREILNNKKYRYSPLIAQKYIEGADGGLNIFSISGELRALSIQKYVKNGVEFVSNSYLEEMAAKLCELTVYNGVMNLDVRTNEATGETYFTEANPRFWASTFASTWAGINFVAESMKTQIPNSNAKKLLSGRFSGNFNEKRHPLFEPSLWLYLFKDRGERGRMARAIMFDMYILPKYIKSLPRRTISYSKKWLRRGPATVPHS